MAHANARIAPIASDIVVRRDLKPCADLILNGFRLVILSNCVDIRKLFSYLETNKVHAIVKFSPETGKLEISRATCDTRF